MAGGKLTLSYRGSRQSKKYTPKAPKDQKIISEAVRRSKKYLHKQLEDKTLATHVSSWTVIPATAVSTIRTDLTTVAQGTDDHQRSGREISGRRLILNLMFKRTGANDAFVRVIIFVWNDDTTPDVTDVLTASEVQSTLSYDEKPKRGRIILDRLFAMTDSYEGKVMRINKFMRNHKTKYTSSADTSGIQGRIYLFMACTDADTVYYQNSFRYVFEDA